MALPTTLTSFQGLVGEARNHHIGPFIDGNGNVYIVACTATLVAVWKATDPESSFSEQDSTNRPTNTGIGGIDVRQVGTALWMVTQRTTSGSTDVEFHVFNTSDASSNADSWTTANETVLSPASAPTISSFECNPRLEVKSGGAKTDARIFAFGEREKIHADWYERLSVFDWNGSSWDETQLNTGVSIDAGFPCGSAIQSDNVIHWMRYYNLTMYQASYSTGDSLSGWEACGSSNQYNYNLGRGRSVDVSGTERTRWATTELAGAANAGLIYVNDDGTPTTDNNCIDAAALAYDYYCPAIDYDGSDLWAVFIKQTDGDVYYNSASSPHADADWGTSTETRDCTGTGTYCQGNIYTRDSVKVFAFVYLDGSTWKYDEHPLVDAVNITVQDSTHASIADSPAITQTHAVTVADAAHLQLGGEAFVSQTHIISTNESTHASIADQSTLQLVIPIVVAEAAHASIVDSPAITQTHVVAANESTHTSIAVSPAVTQTHVVAANESTHTSIADSPAVTQTISVTAQEAAHASIADSPAVTQTHILTVAEATHASIADQPTITWEWNIVVAEATHASIADAPAITQTHAITVAEAAHASIADAPAITQTHVITVAEAAHASIADSPTVEEATPGGAPGFYFCETLQRPLNRMAIPNAKSRLLKNCKLWYQPGIAQQNLAKPFSRETRFAPPTYTRSDKSRHWGPYAAQDTSHQVLLRDQPIFGEDGETHFLLVDLKGSSYSNGVIYSTGHKTLSGSRIGWRTETNALYFTEHGQNRVALTFGSLTSEGPTWLVVRGRAGVAGAAGFFYKEPSDANVTNYNNWTNTFGWNVHSRYDLHIGKPYSSWYNSGSNATECNIYLIAMYNEYMDIALIDEMIRLWERDKFDPWWKPSVFYCASQDAATPVNVTAQEASHSSIADQPAITQTHAVTVQEAAHASTADQPVLSQTHVVTAAEATHASIADQPAITQTQIIVVAETVHASIADQPAITQTHAVTVQEATHASIADQPAITQTHVVTVAEATHASIADQPAISQTQIVVAAEATHASIADQPVITQTHVISSQEATHASIADQPAISQTHVVVVSESTHASIADQPDITAGVQVVPAEATHGSTADQPVITQTQIIVVQEAAHASIADQPVITQAHVVAANESTHASIADQPTITFELNVVPAEATHASTADQPAITQTHVVVVQEATHASIADQPSVTIAGYNIVVQEALHASIADSPTITQTHVIVPAEATHASTADQPTITQTQFIIVAEATHASTADNVTVTVGDISITVQETSHASTADQPAITQTQIVAAHDATHASPVDSPAVTQTHVVSAAEATHASTADSPTVGQTHVIVAADSTHAAIADSPTITQVHGVTVQEATHASTADQPAITQTQFIIVAEATHASIADQPFIAVNEKTIDVDSATHASIADSVTITSGWPAEYVEIDFIYLDTHGTSLTADIHNVGANMDTPDASVVREPDG